MNLRTRGGSLAVGSIFFAVTGFAACSGDGPRGAAGSTAIVNTIPEPAGVHCPAGGIKVVALASTRTPTALLSPDEISDTQYVCNGASGDAGPPRRERIGRRRRAEGGSGRRRSAGHTR